jgi:transposase
MGGQHRPYTRQFREQAVKLVMDGRQDPTRTARELGMPFSTLHLWLRKAGWRRPEPEGPALSEEPAVLQVRVRELERQVKRLEMERDILKKATAYFASQNLPASPSSNGGEGSSR